VGEALDAVVEFVVGHFNAMLAGDGARLDVVSTTDDALTLRFVAADGTGDCEACALAPDDLELLVHEALARQGAPGRAVSVLR
jgi:Fe-S cluster biogenesis protein NfuA